MSTVTRTGTLPDSSNKSDFYSLIDSATVGSIVNADIDTGAAIVDTKLAQITTASKVHGSSLTGLASIPSGAGLIPVANIDVGTTASKIVQLNGSAQLPAVDGSLLTNLSVASFKVGSFTRDMTAASGDVSYTGVGFIPKAIIMTYGLTTSSKMVGFGLSTLTGKGSISLRGDAAGADPAAAAIYADSGAGTGQQSAIVKTFDADGFTLTWTKTSSPTGTLQAYYMAIG